jgi:myosin-5
MRCPQFIKIHFSNAGRITGASIEKYLLEKTRLVRQIDGERNFHIFYQLLKGCSETFLSYLGLERSIESYLYISSNVDSSTIPNVSDADEWLRTTECLSSITEDHSVQADIFQLLASILHLGNVSFQRMDAEESAGGVTPESKQSLAAAAQLLGLEPDDIIASLTKQNMYVNNNVIVKGQTVEQAQDKQSSLAKSVYSLLFSWLVDKITCL